MGEAFQSNIMGMNPSAGDMNLLTPRVTVKEVEGAKLVVNPSQRKGTRSYLEGSLETY